MALRMAMMGGAAKKKLTPEPKAEEATIFVGATAVDPVVAEAETAAATATAKALEVKRAEIAAKVAAAKIAQQLAVADVSASSGAAGAGKVVTSLDQFFTEHDEKRVEHVFEHTGKAVKGPAVVWRPHMQTGKFNKP